MRDLLPDLFDCYGDHLCFIGSHFNQYGKHPIFWGEVVTVKCFEDNSKVKAILAQDGRGKVLVVDGSGSRKALLGDLITQTAVDNGWSGIVISGNVRDVGRLKSMNIGIQALGVNPIKTEKKDLGEVNIPLALAGVIINPGMFLYADDNGVAVSASRLDLSQIS